jgi:hypothetical protein
VRDPWSEIAPSEHPSIDNVRRVDATHPLDFKRGRDFQGRYLLILEGTGLLTPSPDVPSLDGVAVDLQQNDTGFRLILTLLSHPDYELFRALCSDLMGATRSLRRTEAVSGLLAILARIKRWQDLLRRSRHDVLTYQQVIGLAGELFFLRDMLLGRMNRMTAVAMWRGPYDDEQDFVVSGTIFELKTQLTTADAKLQISSENQLDTTSGAIIVVHQTLAIDDRSADQSRTLNGLVAEIITVLEGDPDALDLFRAGLLAANYSQRREYDETAWAFKNRRFFEVRDDFPRITPALLPSGVERVRYLVTVDSCAPFEVDVADTMNRVFHVEG